MDGDRMAGRANGSILFDLRIDELRSFVVATVFILKRRGDAGMPPWGDDLVIAGNITGGAIAPPWLERRKGGSCTGNGCAVAAADGRAVGKDVRGANCGANVAAPSAREGPDADRSCAAALGSKAKGSTASLLVGAVPCVAKRASPSSAVFRNGSAGRIASGGCGRGQLSINSLSLSLFCTAFARQFFTSSFALRSCPRLVCHLHVQYTSTSRRMTAMTTMTTMSQSGVAAAAFLALPAVLPLAPPVLDRTVLNVLANLAVRHDDSAALQTPTFVGDVNVPLVPQTVSPIHGSVNSCDRFRLSVVGRNSTVSSAP